MKHFRLIISIIMLILILALLSFGVYSILKGNSGVSNNTDFNSGDENVFVRVECSYDGPELVSTGATPTQSYEIKKDDPSSYENGPITLNSWFLGETNFTNTENKISLTFVITNLNDKNGLNINFSNLAYDSAKRFTTSYVTGNSTNDLETSEPIILNSNSANSVVDVPQLTIGAGQTIYVRLIYELKNFSSAFAFNNNITVLFSTVLQ